MGRERRSPNANQRVKASNVLQPSSETTLWVSLIEYKSTGVSLRGAGAAVRLCSATQHCAYCTGVCAQGLVMGRTGPRRRLAPPRRMPPPAHRTARRIAVGCTPPARTAARWTRSCRCENTPQGTAAAADAPRETPAAVRSTSPRWAPLAACRRLMIVFPHPTPPRFLGCLGEYIGRDGEWAGSHKRLKWMEVWLWACHSNI